MRTLILLVALVFGISALSLREKRAGNKKCPELPKTTGHDTGIYSFSTADVELRRGTFTCSKKNKIVEHSATIIRIDGENVKSDFSAKDISINLTCNQKNGVWQYEGKDIKSLECEQNIAQSG